MMRKVIISFLVTFLTISKSLYGYDDEKTHRQLTERAIDKSSLSVYLENNLEFKEGTSSLINNKTITWWIREGAYLEDSPMCRASNHFHNPLLSWDQSYMSDDITTSGLAIRAYCILRGWPYWDRKSLVTWGTGYLSPAPAGTKITISKQEWGWDNARAYYYQALTSASNADREAYFTKTFQALGQVLHLIEDGAQPGHVRNDFTSHLTFTGVEFSTPLRWVGSQFEHYVKNNPGLVTSATPETTPFFTRLTDFWDTDQYNGSNPSASWSIGITEFTNANYFSDETIPNNDPTPLHIFPFPQVNNLNAQICEDYVPGSTDIRRYMSRKDRGPCPDLSDPNNAGTADHFATLSLVNEEYLITNNNISTLKLLLDDNVHNTYAKELLPRAVGYSAGLINYFFRGQMEANGEVTKDNDGNITGITVKVKNLTPNETMSDGTFVVSYRYKPTSSTEYIYGLSNEQSSGTIPYNNNPDDYKYSLSFSISDPIPKDAEDIQYILVFNGSLGNEVGAVIGKVVSLREVDYVFIIQDRLSLNSVPIDCSDDAEHSDYDHGYTARVGLCERWDVYEQVLSGRFVTYGEIESIRLKVISLYGGDPDLIETPALFINGEAIADRIWTQGDTPDPPETWEVRGTGRWRPSVGLDYPGAVSLSVIMKDRSIFTLSPFSYFRVWRYAVKTLGHYELKSVTKAEINIWEPYLATPYQEHVFGRDIFEVIQISGHGPHRQGRLWYETVPDPYWYLRVSYYEASYADLLGIDSGYRYRYDVECARSRCIPDAKTLYDSLNVQLPPLTIQGILRRIYSQEEQDLLSRLGIPREDYDLILE